MATPNKSLGQHWLYDEDSLVAMCESAEISASDTVLEIGPGLGTLTRQLSKRAGRVIAVEFDPALAAKLAPQFPGTKVDVVHQDILKFDLSTLPKNYKVVANVPYYITSKIVEFLLTSDNPPVQTSLLVQKEVAERMAAQPGKMSILAVATQYYAQATLGPVVPAELFTPPPKVDSQIITLRRREQMLYPDISTKLYFRIIKAGFSAKRKKLRSSLSAGLGISKIEVEKLLLKAQVNPDDRAETLSLDEWASVIRAYSSIY